MIKKHLLFAFFQIKSTFRAVPRLILCTAVFAAAVIVIGLCGNELLSDSQDRTVNINVAAVIPEGDTSVALGFQVISSMDSLKSMCRFIAMDHDEAISALRDGKISAIIEIPENFVDDLMYGKNTPATITIPENAGMETLIFRSMISAGAKSLASSESGIYAVSDLLEYYGYHDYVTASQDELYDFYMKYAFNRMYFYDGETVSATGQTSSAGYYICSGIILLLLLCSMVTIDRFSNRPPAVMESLKTGGISKTYVRLCEYIGVVLMFFVLFTAILIICSHTAASEYITLNAGVILSLLLVTASVIAFVMFLCCIGDCGLVSTMLVFLTGAFMLYAGGRIVPGSYLPEIIEKTGNVLPAKSWCTLIESAFYRTPDINAALICAAYAVLFLGAGILVTVIKGRDR